MYAYSNFTVSTVHQKPCVFFAEPDLGMFSMFGRTAAPQKGVYRPQNVGQQRVILWPLRASLCRVATLMRCSTTINIIGLRLLNSESRISNEVIAAKLHIGLVVTLNSWQVFVR